MRAICFQIYKMNIEYHTLFVLVLNVHFERIKDMSTYLKKNS